MNMTLDKPLFQLTGNEFLELMKEAQNETTKEKQPPDYIRGIANLAARLKVSAPTVQKWKNEGIIPYVQRGRFIYFDFDAVLEALNKNNK